MRVVATLLVAVALAGACGGGGDDVQLSDGNVTMTAIDQLPSWNGDATAVTIAPDGRVLAIVDGALVEVRGEAFTPIDGSGGHLALEAGPDGTLYSATSTQLLAYPPGAATPITFTPGGPIATVHFTFSTSGTVLASVADSFPTNAAFRSDDHGRTWTPQRLSASGATSYVYAGDIAIAPDGSLWMSMWDSFQHSTDGGATWTSKPSARPSFGGRIIPTADGKVYHYVPGAGGLQVTTDEGASWRTLTPFNEAPGWTVMRLAADGSLIGLGSPGRPGGNGLFYRFPQAVFRSTDGGTTFTTLHYVRAHDVAVRGDAIAVGLAMREAPEGRDGGVLTTTDGGAIWRRSGTTTIDPTLARDFAFDADDRLLLSLDWNVFRRGPDGWTSVAADNIGKLARLRDGTLLAVGIVTTTISTDGGRTWTRRVATEADRRPFGGASDSFAIPSIVASRRSDSALVSFTAYDPVTREVHDGVLRRMTAAGESDVAQAGYVQTLLVDSAGVLFALAEGPNGGQFRSTDDGASWMPHELGPARAFNSIDRYFSSDFDGFYLTSTDGTRQTLTVTGFPDRGYLVQQARFDARDHLFLLGGGGLYESTGPVR